MYRKPSVSASLLLAFAIAFAAFQPAFARDEGMFTPDRIASLGLQKRGMKIKPEDIYNPRGGGLTEAVIRLNMAGGGGCTAEFVSASGLILTNHHCVLDGLVTASSPERDLVEDGFKADDRSGEIHAEGFSINITERIEDVTARVLQGMEKLDGQERTAAIAERIKELEAAENEKAGDDSVVRIYTLNNGFFYYLYQTREIKDVRMVYAPPRNIGVFGGDPDNFEWTRHTGDFAFLRAYVAPDGSSADHAASNVPYKPNRFLTMNIGGLKENDFVFVLGYPGGTTRYRESQSIEFARDANFPFLASWLAARADALRLVGETDEEKRIALQSDIANFDNARKVYDGGRWRLRRSQVVEKRLAEEERFKSWVAANPARQQRYGTVLQELAELSAESNRYARRDVVIRRFPEPGMAIMSQIVLATLETLGNEPLSDKELAEKRGEVEKELAGREPIYEREMLKYFFRAFAELPEGQKFAWAEERFGKFEGRERRLAEEKFAAEIAEGDYWNIDTIMALYGPQTTEYRPERDDPRSLAIAFITDRRAAEQRAQKFASQIFRLRLLYEQGMAEMKGTTPYPDANFTQRFSYGNIKGYSPREAEYRSPFTTIKGMMEKDTGINPFDMPDSLKRLQAARDFGRFGEGDSVVVNFISTNDIIGGNSGSPILNANGEQVGICFDGNYEGLGNDFYYDPDRNRTISVDIRFVLFVTEKIGNAGWILDEMRIVGGPRVRAAGR